MSEAQVAVTDRWTDGRRDPGKSRGPRTAPRSLKDALSEAGLASDSGLASESHSHDAPMRRRDVTRRREPASLAVQSALRLVEEQPSPLGEGTPSHPAAQRVAVVEEVLPLISSSNRVEKAQGGVVSPPPWVRAARRGRLRARFMNAFGWLVTIMVIGSIISVAGRYLVVPPGVESIYTARQ